MTKAARSTSLMAAALLFASPLHAQQQRAPGQQDSRPGIAVLDFEIGATIGQEAEDYDALRRGLASLTLSELTANPGVRVVERAQLQQLLTEQNLGREGRVDPQTIVRIGRLVGARYMVTGTIYDVRGDFRINSRIFDSETGEVLRTQTVRGRLENVFDLASQLAGQLMRDANLPPLERRAMEEHRERNPAPPQNAVMAYSRAVLYADRGDTQRAVEQYRRAVAAFPQYTQARTECNRLQQGACT